MSAYERKKEIQVTKYQMCVRYREMIKNAKTETQAIRYLQMSHYLHSTSYWEKACPEIDLTECPLCTQEYMHELTGERTTRLYEKVKQHEQAEQESWERYEKKTKKGKIDRENQRSGSNVQLDEEVTDIIIHSR